MRDRNRKVDVQIRDTVCPNSFLWEARNFSPSFGGKTHKKIELYFVASNKLKSNLEMLHFVALIFQLNSTDFSRTCGLVFLVIFLSLENN